MLAYGIEVGEMKTMRKILAAPFFGIGMVFLGIAALIVGEPVDWLDQPKQTHH